MAEGVAEGEVIREAEEDGGNGKDGRCCYFSKDTPRVSAQDTIFKNRLLMC